jgi:hypothetical protein
VSKSVPDWLLQSPPCGQGFFESSGFIIKVQQGYFMMFRRGSVKVRQRSRLKDHSDSIKRSHGYRPWQWPRRFDWRLGNWLEEAHYRHRLVQFAPANCDSNCWDFKSWTLSSIQRTTTGNDTSRISLLSRKLVVIVKSQDNPNLKK